jgi:trehalose 6-phosphate phosphatase
MKILNQNFSLDKFFDQLALEDQTILFLDYDGTLAPFREDPDDAVPYPGIREILQKLLDCTSTRVVIVTGRYTRDIIPLLAINSMPEIWGSHGLERLKPDGSYEVEDIDEHTRKGLQKAEEFISEHNFTHRLERKPGCLALHWRGLSEKEMNDLRQSVEEEWRAIAGHYKLLMKEFNGGLELRSPGKNKGNAVTEVLSESPQTKKAAYLGDDLTDEDAFASLKGRGLSVLVRKNWRDTRADLWIKPPEELVDFLNRWIEAC